MGAEDPEAEQDLHVEQVAKTQCHNTLRRLRKFRKRVRRAVVAFVNSRQCFILIIMLVFLNTVVLTTEHHNQPSWLDKFQGESFPFPKGTSKLWSLGEPIQSLLSDNLVLFKVDCTFAFGIL
ncbi:unnamed protein product [Protopolystoma xenopodis]|uniref:Ion transport domain-containing protein n=1 Tax=Protopolystoma xenopodis TaxID=117903 RepID=A0A448XF12_9PLAT|nr:unnamed protein product [Protopolystoma xenopodis]